MADRIANTVQNTSSTIQKLADTSAVKKKIVGGVIKEEIPLNTEGKSSGYCVSVALDQVRSIGIS